MQKKAGQAGFLRMPRTHNNTICAQIQDVSRIRKV
jgi:hypothetical protein